MIDGIRVNNSVFRDGPNQYWNTIDHFTIDMLELVKGPSSVLYGSDAIGGTVAIRTQKRNRLEDGFHWNGKSVTRLSSADRSWVQRIEGSANHGNKLGVIAGFTYKDFGDVNSGDDHPVQKKTGYNQVDGNFRADYYFNDNHSLTLAYQTVDQDDVWRTHRTVFAESWRDSPLGLSLIHI